jgi:hypothetical protein
MRHLLAVLLLLGLAARADADAWTNPYTGRTWNNPTSSLIDTMIQQRMQRDMLERALARKKDGAAATSPPVKHEPYSKSDFAGSKKRVVVDALIASLVSTAEQKQALATGINQVFDAFEKQVRRNNVAYALAFMLAAAVMVEREVQMSDEQTEELAAGINDLLARSAPFQKSGAADRQKLYESFVTVGALILIFAEVGKGDADSAKAAKALAGQALAMVGVK